MKENRNESLEVTHLKALPQAFAVVKETAKRFKENGEFEKSSHHDGSSLAANAPHIIHIEGDSSRLENEWDAAGSTLKWEMPIMMCSLSVVLCYTAVRFQRWLQVRVKPW